MSEKAITGRWKVTLLAIMLVTLVWLVFAAVARGDDRSDRLDKKVRVMEKVLDEVLGQSKHVRVGMSNEATGLIVDDYGAIFLFRGEIGADIERMPGVAALLRSMEEMSEHEEEEEGEASSAPEKGKPPKQKSLDELRKEFEAKRNGELAGLREELVDTVLDYGPTLAELGEDRWVMVVGVLDGGIFSEYAPGGGRNTMVVKAKVSDLRQFAAGTLSRQAASTKVVVVMK
jgi:hypothetical protein